MDHYRSAGYNWLGCNEAEISVVALAPNRIRFGAYRNGCLLLGSLFHRLAREVVGITLRGHEPLSQIDSIGYRFDHGGYHLNVVMVSGCGHPPHSRVSIHHVTWIVRLSWVIS